jgi:hypothetical protein
MEIFVDSPLPPPPPPTGRRWLPATRGGRIAMAAAVGGAAVLIGVGVAAAQTGGTATPPPTPTPGQVPAPGPPPGGGIGGRFGGKGFGGPGGFGMPGLGGVLHGEFVRSNRSGGYQTLDMHVGQVTSVSSTSITLKSADGFSKSYGVDDGTVVDAGRDGIGSVKSGDQVQLLAVVSGSSANAVSINDSTNLRSLKQRWNPMPTPPANGTGGTGGSGATSGSGGSPSGAATQPQPSSPT